jgi:ribosomal protein S12 methylthiotransferase accessory factor
VLGFLRKRGLSIEGVSLRQRMHTNPVTGMVGEIEIDIQVPPDFPERYLAALIRTAELCAVKKHFENPPSFNIQTSVKELVVNS